MIKRQLWAALLLGQACVAQAMPELTSARCMTTWAQSAARCKSA